MIYLDHNATTPLHPQVLEAMLTCLQEHWGNPSSPHSLGNQARTVMQQARLGIAESLGCEPSEVVFCSSGTEADNLALRGVAGALRSRGNHIVTTAIEHHAVLHTCDALEGEGFRVTRVPVDPQGVVDLEALERSLTDQTILVSVMHANNETGVLQPVEEVARMAARREIPFHVDAVQTVGKLPFCLSELGAGLVSFSGHKLYGPRGAAALFVRAGTPLRPILTGGSHEHGLRAGTENLAGMVGLAKAVELAVQDVAEEGRRLAGLRDDLESRLLASIPEARINGDRARRVPNTSNVTFPGVDGESIILALDLAGICASTGSACSTGEPEPSHVLREMGVSRRDAQGSIRLSLGRETRQEDLDLTVQALAETVARLRRITSI
ncbi:MAG: cysteine desulfurase family protein [Candidatus Xenobium sp.]|jgi:cysteine desulfurase|nr:cysteine desulfurase [Burkholderiales bacterium]